MLRISSMSIDTELAFADRTGSFFARVYGTAPMVGRVAGWLLVSEQPDPTIGEIAEALKASRTAVSQAVELLVTYQFVTKTRAAGERADRVRIRPNFGMDDLETARQQTEMAELARSGLSALDGEPEQRKARLLELAAIGDFLAERMPRLADEWREHRAQLHAAGLLPPPPT